MRSILIGAVVALVALSVPMVSVAQATPRGIMMKDGMLVNSKGMTLYTFDKDSEGKSACEGKCLQNWPAAKAPASAKAMGDWSVVTRSDGTGQWAYKGKPLYTFVKDAAAGDTKGDGAGNGVWHVAKTG